MEPSTFLRFKSVWERAYRHNITISLLNSMYTFNFTFMHLADAFIQSDLQAMHCFFYQCSLGIEPTTFCAANTMLYHWATGTHHMALYSDILLSPFLLDPFCAFLSGVSSQGDVKENPCTRDFSLANTLNRAHLSLRCSCETCRSMTMCPLRSPGAD